MIYSLSTLLVAAWAIIRGFRKGLASRTHSAIGVAFGIVSARLLAPGLYSVLYDSFSSVHGEVEEQFVYDTLSTSIVFISVYAVFALVTSFLGKVLTRDDRTILDNIGGAIFSLFKYLLFLSIMLNMIISFKPDSELVKSGKSDDGNIVQQVLMISPSVLGGEDIMELCHKIQLKEAKKIS